MASVNNDGAVQGIVLATGGTLVWALALYVASRAPTRRGPILAALAMLCLAAYFVGEALAALAPDPEVAATWSRRAWWAPATALASWLVLTLTLAVDEGPEPLSNRAGRFLAVHTVVVFAVGAFFGIVGTLAPMSLAVLRVYQAFALGCLLWAATTVLRLWRGSPSQTPLRARFAWLSASAAIFLLGGGWIVIGSGIYELVGLPGHLLLIVGMLILGWNMARYGALLAGERVLGDFVAYAATMLGVVGLYGGILLVLAPDYGWFERGLPLLLIVMTTHVLVDTRGNLLDRVLYAPVLRTLRGQLRDLGNRVVRQPDDLTALVDVREMLDQILQDRTDTPASTTEMRVLVEGALRHLNDLPDLCRHPLMAELPSVANLTGTPLERAAALRNELDQAIERLRPAGARPSPGSSALGGWLHYLVLKEAYVDGRPNKQIMQRYALSEGTFHRARRRAIDALASDLGERSEVRSQRETV